MTAMDLQQEPTLRGRLLFVHSGKLNGQANGCESGQGKPVVCRCAATAPDAPLKTASAPAWIGPEIESTRQPRGFIVQREAQSIASKEPFILKHWGTHKLMREARRGAWWDANKIGLCNPPIETERGWLVVYHGVRPTASGSLYRLGLALFDLNDPATCLIRGDEWIMGADRDYARVGDVGNVVFPCGHTVLPDGDTLRLYYGGTNHVIAAATMRIRSLLDWLDAHGRHYAPRLADSDEHGPYRNHDQRR